MQVDLFLFWGKQTSVLILQFAFRAMKGYS